MRRLRDYMHHCLNPMHVYCRLMDIGLDKAQARRMSWAYERFLHIMLWNG